MTKIVPTVGRVVWYFETPHSEKPLAGTVAYVHSDSCVNLTVHHMNGDTSGRTSVPLVQAGEPHPPGHRCEWMPYQVGQAAKTEAAEKKLEEATTG
jgi:hypothetical protein